MPSRDTCTYTLKTLDEVMSLSTTLSAYFPSPEQAKLGIYELLLNAMEHGNLELGHDLKAELVRTGRWKDEIMRRLSLPQYQTREVLVRLVVDRNTCYLSIADQGKGFPWKHYLSSSVSRKAPNGRGLLIAFNSNFDSVSFNEIGNEVTCVSKLSA